MDVVLCDIDNLKEWELMHTWWSLPNSLEDHIKGIAKPPASGDTEAERAFSRAVTEARAIAISTIAPELLVRINARLNPHTAAAQDIVAMARRIVLTDVNYEQSMFEFVSLDRLEFPSLMAFRDRMDFLWQIVKTHHSRVHDFMYITVALKAIKCYHGDVFEELCEQGELSMRDIVYWLDFLVLTDDEFC
ncbi:hypothetical protein JDV02_005075 [Purpureocillium takamizusanense]|uniref:Uncharacterized protein n=1 Tax=Purpureocillium takamizusanense TaxID=2060973 RepID=A0A9Q8VBF1_9HYPO|nr:uncharacterized protein JDV02_005075 [Purpureocillium takamizusanense]UNI18829.1 hypothetical protein JDV02_005075 [Purpureocillium takamizusanense]